MRFALIDSKKIEATEGAKGFCPCCNSEMVPKCGDLKINHWAHKGKRICDPWWENETDWHRNWKNQFPSDWQEVVQFDENDLNKLCFNTVYFGLPNVYFLCILSRPKSKGVHKHAFMSLSFNPELTQVLHVLKQVKLPKAS